MSTLQGAEAFDQQYITLLILLRISALIILIFYIYYGAIHEWIKKMNKAGIQKNL